MSWKLFDSSGREKIGTSTGIDDTAFASSWNGDTANAPTKNAVYDELHKIDSSDDGTIVNAGTGFRIAGAASSGKIIVGNGTNFVASTPTFPNASATSGKIIKSDGTNWAASTETYAAPGTSGNVLTSNGTNWLSSSPTGGVSAFTGLSDVPASYSGQSLKHVRVNTGETALEFVTLAGGGDALTANPLSQFASTTSAQLRTVLSDENGTGAALFDAATTPTFTTGLQIGGAAGSGKILKGNGTNFVPSTETYAAPGTSGNVLTSDGTNWTSATPAGGGGGTTSKVSGSDFTTSSTTLVNITGLTFAASANTLYEIDVTLDGLPSDSNGAEFAIAYSAAGGLGNPIFSGTAGAAAAAISSRILGTATSSTFWATANNVSLRIQGCVKIGANAGNITVQCKKTTAGSVTIYIGSRMTVTPL